ncbi:MAG: threonine--tRNA ligase [Nanoarchaeota archaeon]
MKIEYKGKVYNYDEKVDGFKLVSYLETEEKEPVIAMKVDGECFDLARTIDKDCKVEFLTFRDGEGKDIFWHSTSHLMAAAIKKLWPHAHLAIGPAVEDGFYYDIDLDESISEDNFRAIEKEMYRLVKSKSQFERTELSKKEALEKVKGNPYKEEMINELESDMVSFYRLGEFEDPCTGPHVPNAGLIKGFKLTKVAGAYWRGDSKNKQLQRIYGVAFPTKEELKEYLAFLEEAKKRDHRLIGKKMDLFCFSDLVGPGLPLFTPKGTIMKEELQREVEKICRKYGFEKVSTPHLANIELFKTSGHAEKFSDELFHVTSKKDHEMVMKPVQCPHQTQIYASKTRSYNDLPIRYMESEKQYRAELSGTIGGLSRVYAITCEDGHSFCRVDQVKQEIINIVNIIKDFYSRLGLLDNYWVSLSLRDYDTPENYIGDKEDWDRCERMLEEVSDELELNAKKCEGEAAIYGPKLDFMFKDAMGKEIQIPTVQLDFATPKRFNLTYFTNENTLAHPVMVHRAILGSYERFFVLLIEHFAGKFPLWLSPVQVKILPIAERHIEYCQKVYEKMTDAGLRVEVNDKTQTTNKKIREAQLENVNYILVVGDNEVEGKTVNVRTRKNEVLGEKNVDGFIKELKQEIVERKI